MRSNAVSWKVAHREGAKYRGAPLPFTPRPASPHAERVQAGVRELFARGRESVAAALAREEALLAKPRAPRKPDVVTPESRARRKCYLDIRAALRNLGKVQRRLNYLRQQVRVWELNPRAPASVGLGDARIGVKALEAQLIERRAQLVDAYTRDQARVNLGGIPLRAVPEECDALAAELLP